MHLQSVLYVEIAAPTTVTVTIRSSTPPANNPSTRTETAPSQRDIRVFHACSNFLGMIAVAIAGAINHTSSSPATRVANDSKSVHSCSPSDVQSLTRIFRKQREQLAADCSVYAEIPDRPPQTSDSFYSVDLVDIDICPNLSKIVYYSCDVFVLISWYFFGVTHIPTFDFPWSSVW